MTGSATAYLLWAILSCIFLLFLVLHLWAYDRFNCLRWHSGRQPGAFKRVMTYSYLATVPLLVVFSVAMSAVKFQEGYYLAPNGRILPRPQILWTPSHRRWLLPLHFVLSTAWSLELVTHLEELAFWLFLLHQGPGKREWFKSWEFRTWYIGSIVAVLGMPLTTLVTRREIDRTQSWIFLAGSTAGTATTVVFLYVLWRFPAFIQHVKDGGAEPDVVVRLATFYNLNRIRVMFRFLFTVPLLAIAIDGLQGPYPIISNPFALDFLLMMGGIGCFISSAITLLVFFPRSITKESGYKPKVPSPKNSEKAPTGSPLPRYPHDPYHQQLSSHHEYTYGYGSFNPELLQNQPGTQGYDVAQASAPKANVFADYQHPEYPHLPESPPPRFHSIIYDIGGHKALGSHFGGTGMLENGFGQGRTEEGTIDETEEGFPWSEEDLVSVNHGHLCQRIQGTDCYCVDCDLQVGLSCSPIRSPCHTAEMSQNSEHASVPVPSTPVLRTDPAPRPMSPRTSGAYVNPPTSTSVNIASTSSSRHSDSRSRPASGDHSEATIWESRVPLSTSNTLTDATSIGFEKDQYPSFPVKAGRRHSGDPIKLEHRWSGVEVGFMVSRRLDTRRRSEEYLAKSSSLRTRLSMHARRSERGYPRPGDKAAQLHPLVLNFTSPIDLFDYPKNELPIKPHQWPLARSNTLNSRPPQLV